MSSCTGQGGAEGFVALEALDLRELLLKREGERLTRWLELNHNRMLRTAYVEAVATEEAYRRRGYASMIMRRVQKEIQGYHLGTLSPFNVKFYERLGWELRRGPLFIRTEKGLIPSPTDEEVMIFRLPETPDLDLTAPLSVEWREGEAW